MPSIVDLYGWKGFFIWLFDYGDMPQKWYDIWLDKYEIKAKDYPYYKNKINSWNQTPLISIIMPVYNTNNVHLKEAIESIRQQVYPYWQLCIADDASSEDSGVKDILRHYEEVDSRINVVFRTTNGHISAASNSALDLAKGEFVALMDHDDMLHPLALWFLADSIIKNPQVGLIYTDHDKLSFTGRRCNPYFKCDFNHEIMLAHNLVAHLSCYRLSLLTEIGGFRQGFEGSQDYDLALRCIERLPREHIIHIPFVLYHWRKTPNSTSSDPLAKPYAFNSALKSVSDYLKRNDIPGKLDAHPKIIGAHRLKPEFSKPHPLVSIIIPTRDRVDLLKPCIDSIWSLTTYSNYEIIIVDNGSIETETLNFFEKIQKKGIRIIRDERAFNYSRLNNLAVKEANGTLICLLNNDIEIISPDWLEEMVFFAQQSDVGVVGAKLWYPNNKLQHGGVILGLGLHGRAGHAFVGLSRDAVGYMGRASIQQELSAVTGACQVVRKKVFEEVNGLDESLPVGFNDIDFCLRVRKAGYRNIWTPFAEMYHHQSASRGTDKTVDKIKRFLQESELLNQRWGNLLLNDPCYSPNLSLKISYYLASPPRCHNTLDTSKKNKY
ncbi:glycosyltransferase family 2 protein [Cyanobacterium sp. Dongsha4]|uniref:glycosyltransferase family 2 protein n=1 Tax=Cyanobacterium sp. DS4 TaxID=2878255 RepID=UPI002E81AC72|nr:glycosyltransferase family 2 protein [Cyanobacterium sp. Dongsha4]WVL00501.1 glycosyltransferase family 2 protein [Cyanobacterium sp. Dongsha4]